MPVFRAESRHAVRDSRSGFTLVELLAGMAIFTVLIMMLFQIANQTSSTWIQSEGQNERQQNGRAILSSIAAEVQCALLSTGGKSDLQFVVNPAGIAAEQKNPSAVFWQAPLATDRRLGDVAEIGYFVKWDTSSANNPRAKLCRFFVNPVAPGGATPAANPDFLIYEKPEAWITAALVGQISPADQASRYRGLFSENVLGLWLRCLAPNGDVISQDAEGVEFAAGSFDSRRGYTWTGGVAPKNSLPAAVEISVALVNAHAARRIDPALHESLSLKVQAATDAAAFSQSIRGVTELASFAASIRNYSTVVFLENAK